VSHNTLIHQIVRPAVRAVAPSGVTPNHLTTLRLVTGLAAALGFAVGGRWAMFGGAVFVLSMLLDRADGELARQTNQMSEAGYRYDLFSDCAASMAAFLGVGVGLAPGMGPLGPLLGALAGVGIAVLFWQLNVAKIGELRGFEFWGGRITVDPDDAMIFVPILIWCGADRPMLLAAAVATPGAALWLGFEALRVKRER